MRHAQRLRRTINNRTCRETGATAVEFALVMLPLIYLVFGIIQYGLYFYASNTGTNAVGDAVRRLTVGDCQTESDLRAFLENRLGAATSASASQLTFLDGSGAVTNGPVYRDASGLVESAPGTVGGSITLTVRFPAINMHFPFIPLPDDGYVTTDIFGRVEDTSPSGSTCA